MPRITSSDESERTDALTRTILGNAYHTRLKCFFDSILTPSNERGGSDHTFVNIAFVTRRCSCLFYLYLINNRCSTIEGGNTLTFAIPSQFRIMTESALIDTGRRIGEKICSISSISELPSLILVDDSISYGRALNSVLNTFLREVRESIRINTRENRNEMSKALEWLGQFLRQNVSIRIFAEKDQIKLLQGNYQDLLRSEITLPPNQWNDYSIRLSELVNCADVANTAFVMSVGTNKPEQNLAHWNHVDWSYRGFLERVYYRPVLNKDRKKLAAFATVRQIRTTSNHTHRLIPFLFLPQIKTTAFESLEKTVFNQLYDAHLIEEDYQEVQPKLHSCLFSATRTNFITTYLSHSLLLDAVPDVLEHSPEDWDEFKINWTYYEMIEKKIIPDTLLSDLQKKENRNALLSFKTIEELLGNLEIEHPIAEEYRAKTSVSGDDEQQEWNGIFEEYLYDLAIEIEAFAHRTGSARFRPGDNTLYSSHNRRYRFLPDFIHEFEIYLRKFYPDKSSTLSTPETFAVMLQMMDAGAMAVVSDETEGDNETAHQIRICEQALATIPRRFYPHTDLIQFLQSNKWIRYKRRELFIQYYVDQLASEDNLSSQEQKNLCHNIIHYLDWLERGALKSTYWTFGINRHFIIDPDQNTLRPDPSNDQLWEKRRQYSTLFRKIMSNE